MGLLTKHPTNSIALKPTSTPFLGNKNKKGKEKPMAMKVYDTPPNSLKDSNASPKVKTTQGVRVCSLSCSTLGVRRAYWNSGMGNRTNDKWVKYSYELAQTKQQVG
jgi:hypothetical protein